MLKISSSYNNWSLEISASIGCISSICCSSLIDCLTDGIIGFDFDLGQVGLNIMDFCNAFNSATQESEKGMPLPVVINVYEDKSFDFVVKTPPAAVLIRKALNIQKGSGEPNREKVGKLTRAQLEDIAKAKEPDLNANDMDAAVKIIAGTARSMGVETDL